MVDYQTYVLLFFTWLVSTIVIRAIFSRKQNNPKLPPSPRAIPVIGHLHLLSQLTHRTLQKLATRYGPIMHIRLGSVPCVVISTPDMVKEVFKTHDISFSERPQNIVVDHITYGAQGFSFSEYGPYWKFMKKICVSKLLGSQTVTQFAHLRRQETLRLLRLCFEKGNVGEAVDLGGELLRLTNNVMSKMVMSQSHGENDSEAQEVRKLVEDIDYLAGKFNVSEYFWLFRNWDFQGIAKGAKEILENFDRMVDRVVKEHLEERRKRKERGEDGQPNDLLDILLDIHDDENSEMKLTIENIKAFMLDVFVAGSDTTAITAEWALAELINHPHMMIKARQEIDTVVGKSRIVEESDMVNLPYVQAIVKETLRVHPPTPIIIRQSSESCIISGYEIPAKTRLFVNVWAINRDPNHWENPLEFNPERFINKEASEKEQLDVRGQHFQVIPFGTGRRGCPGANLALPTVQTNLAAMIQCFEWKVAGGSETANMEEKSGFGLSRLHPLVCVPVPRLDLSII